MEKKTYLGEVKELTEKGEGIAVISTLGIPDKDSDVTLPGAFGNDQVVPIVPSHQWQHVPLGKARITEVGNEAHAKFQLNMKLGHARAWYEAMAFDLSTPPSKLQWSYAYSTIKADNGVFEEKPVRFLKELQVHEVSPVLLGAGINTRTLVLKGAIWIPLEVVEKCCPGCAKEMREKGWKKINLSALKQDFTCPKPFATFDECVSRFSGEVDDPEAFCAAWEEFCGASAAEAEAEKALALTRKVIQDYWAQRERAIRRPIM